MEFERLKEEKDFKMKGRQCVDRFVDPVEFAVIMGHFLGCNESQAIEHIATNHLGVNLWEVEIFLLEQIEDDSIMVTQR